MKKKFLFYPLGIFIFALIGFIAPTKVKAAVFVDVPDSDSTAIYVDSIYYAGITGGCRQEGANKYYCPDNNVLRKEMAKFLVIAAGKTELKPTTPTFADVPATHPFYGFIERLADPNSWGGTAPTSACKIQGKTKYFCPDNPVTREQMAAFLQRAGGIPLIRPATPTFADVPKTSSFYEPIETIVSKNITAGCRVSGTTKYYCPGDVVTRKQMAVFLARTFLTQIAGYVKEKKADGTLADVVSVNIVDQNDKILGVSSPSGKSVDFFITRFVKKGSYDLRGQKTSFAPYNIGTAVIDKFGWQYTNFTFWLGTPPTPWYLFIVQPGQVKGLVRDGDSADFISDATVRAVSREATSGKVLASVEITSDSSGNFELTNVAPGKVTLTSSKSDYTLKGPVNFDLRIGEIFSDKEVILLPNANFIEGDIETDTGEPLSAAVQIPATASFYGYDMTFSTDWTGHYKAVGIKPGISVPLTIIAAHFMNQSATVSSPSGARQTVIFNFTFITSGIGSMVDTRPGGFTTPPGQCATDTNGNVISEAYVVLSNGGTYSGGEYPEQKWWRKTDANGCVSLDGIPAGIYSVVIFKDFPDGTTKYYALPTPESQITIEHAGTTDFPLNGLQEIVPSPAPSP